jgi:hypothetical protein
MSNPPILLAVTSGGDRWEDPSEDLLHMLLEDLVDQRGGSFLVSRLDAEAGHTLEISLDGDGFQARRQDGRTAVPAVATSGELREVHAACTRWAFGLDDAVAARAQAMWGGFDGTLRWQPEPDTANEPTSRQ